MKKLSATLFGIVIVSTALSAVVSPALALGGCGPNGHRNGAGKCVYGGQNQDFCIRTKGHPAVRMPNGTMRCI